MCARISTCVALQFLHNLLCLQIPDVDHVVLGARHDPLQTAGQAIVVVFFGFFFKLFLFHFFVTRRYIKKKNKTKQRVEVLTFPPVTEKFANMQYFSFLWPVYVFKHCKVQRKTLINIDAVYF